MNAHVWLWDDELAFVPVKVLGSPSSTTREVEFPSGEIRVVEVSDLGESATERSVGFARALHAPLASRGAALAHGTVEDLVQLDEFCAGAVLQQLQLRYAEDLIYTNVGTILISCNPFKVLSCYTSSTLREYLRCAPAAAGQARAPHIFDVASRAYHELASSGKSQSVIISGESGAGKTEATKLVLQLLSEASASSSDDIAHHILMSNPLLEAFGNAKTVRNNNSSRFGKWIAVLFSRPTTGSTRIVGARVVNYLLEKSRVSTLGPGERNFHIFYQLCAGATEAERAALCLAPSETFAYLSGGECLSIPGKSDAAELALTRRAFQLLGFSEEQVQGVFRAVAGVLHLGNVVFSPSKGDDDVATIADDDVLQDLARVLQVEEEALMQALCFRALSVRGDVSQIPLNVEQAEHARDALARFMYSRLFDFLVGKVNRAFADAHPLGDGGAGTASGPCIGILDIFGFEIFEHNSLEQLFINYANEKLQLFFNQYVIRDVMDECQRDGIEGVDLGDFKGNGPCVELFEQRPHGILCMLEEEAFVPRGNDVALAEKLISALSGGKESFFGAVRTDPNAFVVRHFAGEVAYDVTGFVEKVKDKFFHSTTAMLCASKCDLIRELFSSAAGDAAGPSSPSSRAKKNKGTLASKFQSQLRSLMTTIRRTSPQFVRCLKPNADKVPDKFVPPFVLRQMRNAGMLEAVHIRSSGFPIRAPHEAFLAKFTCALREAETRHSSDLVQLAGDTRQRCQLLLDTVARLEPAADIHTTVRVGRTQVFWRATASPTEGVAALEQLRADALTASVVLLQSFARGIAARRRLGVLKTAYARAVQAIVSRDAAMVHQVLEFCDDNGVEIPIVEELEEAQESLEQERALTTQLTQAAQRGERIGIESCLLKAQALVDSLPAGAEPAAAFLEAVAACHSAAEQFEKIRGAIQTLRSALLDSNVDSLRRALDHAEPLIRGAKADEDADVRDPALQELITHVAKVRELEHRLVLEARIGQDLMVAMYARDKAELQTALSAAQGFNAYLRDAERNTVAMSAGNLLCHLWSTEFQRAFVDKGDAAADGVLERLGKCVSALHGDFGTQALLERLSDMDRAMLLPVEVEEEEAPVVEEVEEVTTGQMVPTFTTPAPSVEEEVEEVEVAQQQVEEVASLLVVHADRSVLCDLVSAIYSRSPDDIVPALARFRTETIRAMSYRARLHDHSVQLARTAVQVLHHVFRSQMRDACLTGKSENVIPVLQALTEASDTLNGEYGMAGLLDDLSSKTSSFFRTLSTRKKTVVDVESRPASVSRATPMLQRQPSRLSQAVAKKDVKQLETLLNSAKSQRSLLRPSVVDEDFGSDPAHSEREVRQAEHMLSALSEQNQVVSALRLSVGNLDRDGMSHNLQRARLVGVDGDDEEIAQLQQRAAELCYEVPESQFMAMKARRALSSDEPEFTLLPSRKELRDLRLMQDEFKLSQFSDLRRPDNFAKRCFRHKKEIKQRMLLFQRTNIPRSLVKLSAAYCGTAERSREVKKEAPRIFADILVFTRERFHTFPAPAGLAVIQKGFEEELLRDEIYAQLIKQTTGNMNPVSRLLGWKLMFLCLCAFPPRTEQLGAILLAHIGTFVEDSVGGSLAFATVSEVATQCFLAYRLIVRKPAVAPPSLASISVAVDGDISWSPLAMHGGGDLGEVEEGGDVDVPVPLAPPPLPPPVPPPPLVVVEEEEYGGHGGLVSASTANLWANPQRTRLILKVYFPETASLETAFSTYRTVMLFDDQTAEEALEVLLSKYDAFVPKANVPTPTARASVAETGSRFRSWKRSLWNKIKKKAKRKPDPEPMQVECERQLQFALYLCPQLTAAQHSSMQDEGQWLAGELRENGLSGDSHLQLRPYEV